MTLRRKNNPVIFKEGYFYLGLNIAILIIGDIILTVSLNNDLLAFNPILKV
jgi:hypothetical protein